GHVDWLRKINRVSLAAGEIGHTHFRKTVFAFQSDIVIREAINVFQHDVLPMWNDFLPIFLAWTAYRRGHEAKILAAIVGPDIEEVAHMINVVLVILMAWRQHLQGVAWMSSSKILHFARRLARRNKQDESFAARALYFDVIELV